MPWDSSPSAGFAAAGVRPWLPLGAHAERNVASQRDDPASTLWFCHDLLALRRAAFAGTIPPYTQLPSPPGVWAYRAGEVVVAANFAGEPACLGELAEPLLLSTRRSGGGPEPGGQVSELGPWEGIIAGPTPAAAPPGR